MKKLFYLTTCNTCKRILHELKPGKDVVMQDVKTEKVTEDQLNEMAKLAGSYEALFSKIAMKYRMWGLDKKQLSELDFKNYMLEEYTFIKRPVVICNNKIFIGSSKRMIEGAKEALQNSQKI